jgi:hypothetical protein
MPKRRAQLGRVLSIRKRSTRNLPAVEVCQHYSPAAHAVHAFRDLPGVLVVGAVSDSDVNVDGACRYRTDPPQGVRFLRPEELRARGVAAPRKRFHSHRAWLHSGRSGARTTLAARQS